MYSFHDLDEEVKKEFQMTLEEFVHIENLRWRDQKRGRIIKKILSKEENMVFVISPISYTDNFGKRITEDNILSIELVDTPANIFDWFLAIQMTQYIRMMTAKINVETITCLILKRTLNGMEMFIPK